MKSISTHVNRSIQRRGPQAKPETVIEGEWRTGSPRIIELRGKGWAVFLLAIGYIGGAAVTIAAMYPAIDWYVHNLPAR